MIFIYFQKVNFIPRLVSISVNAQYYSPVYPAYGYSNAAAAGAAGTQFGQQTGSSETHDKKNFGVNFDSDKGSSNQFSNTNAQGEIQFFALCL